MARSWVLMAVLATGCAKVGNHAAPATDAGRDVIGPPTDGAPPRPPCVNLQCRQVSCPAGVAPTSISGTVYAPNGKLPLYNVMVYVPNAPLEAFPAGVTCDRCGRVASGKPVVSALSDSHGKFTLTNVPAGANVPLVFQVGKWRRAITLPSVTACQDNPLTDANLTRLPRNRQEGDMPKIAVTSGGCDNLGCLLPKLGVDPAELGVAGDDRAVTFYRAPEAIISGGPKIDPELFGPPGMRIATTLWNDEAQLGQYDLALLSCECSENMFIKTAQALDTMTRYLANGGRIFGSHYSYVWLKYTPDAALARSVRIATDGRSGGSPMTIDTTFPKGKALADWMQFVDPTASYGEISARQVNDDLQSVMPPSARAWASSGVFDGPAGSPPGSGVRPRIVTVNTPAGVAAERQCGRVAHLDAHITPPEEVAVPPGQTFPQFCGELSKGEEALAFMFFDLSSCIHDDTTPVEPPIVIP